MSPRSRARRVTSRLAAGMPVDWEAELRAAATDEERGTLQQLRILAAMGALNSALQSADSMPELDVAISGAESVLGGTGQRKRTLHPSDLAPGARWGPLEILERIGRGAFGEVYRARDTRLDREVALKLVAREARSSRGEVVTEARLLARVRHPNVVTVYGAERIEDRVGIWMEFVAGATMEQILSARGPLDAREAASIGLDLSRALSAVHGAGVIHQDVKLSNLMRASGGRVVLMDFGLGRELAEEPPAESRPAISGTPLFMAPELFLGAPPDARSDLYSAGVVLFALVTGRLPIEAANLAELKRLHLQAEIRQARDLCPELPVTFAEIVQRLLSASPESRPATAGELEHALLAFLAASRPADEVSSASPSPTASHRLPEEIDRFFGRRHDVSALAATIASGARLITILGTAGMGKTRLAIHYGWGSLSEWPGGSWFCDLTDASSSEGVAAAVSRGLGVPLGSGDVFDQLGHALGARGRCLIILDNVEPVVEHVRRVIVPWLERCPHARFLITSRVRLGVRGEEVLQLEPMTDDEALTLFRDRARDGRPASPTSETDAASERDLVALLEGMPLALELAAARMHVMTATQLLARFRPRLRVIAGGGPGRHDTLRGAIAGSWELLRPWEQSALAQCSLFDGGFTLEASEAVVDLSPWPEAPWVVDVIQSLVDQSLLRATRPAHQTPDLPGPPRFGMFAAIQEFAREKMEQTGAIPHGMSGPEATRRALDRHGRWFAAYGTDDALLALDAHRGIERRRDLLLEIENLIAAARRSVARGDLEIAVATCRAAWAVLELRGPYATGVELATAALTLPLPPEARCRVLMTLGQAEQRRGHKDRARSCFNEALSGYRELGDQTGEAYAIASLATLLLNLGRLDEALPQLEVALAIHQQTGDSRGAGIVRGNLGLLYHERGMLDQGRAHLEAALSLHRQVGNQRSEGVVLGNLGPLLSDLGRETEARAHFTAALLIHRQVGNRRFEGIVQGNLGRLELRLGRFGEAREHFTAALEIHREVGARDFEINALTNLGDLEVRSERHGGARLHYDGALAIARETGQTRKLGLILADLARLDLIENHRDLAHERLLEGEACLRSVDYRPGLAELLCTRVELELRQGDTTAAQRIRAELESVLESLPPPLDPDLRARVEVLRTHLEPPAPPT